MAQMPEKYQVIYLDPGEYQLWDHFVLESAKGSIFNTTKWADVVRKTFARTYRILTLQRNSQISGGILVWPKGLMNVQALTEVPASPYQGFLLAPSESPKPSSRISEQYEKLEILVQHLIEEYPLITCTLDPSINDSRPFSWNGFTVEPRYTYRFTIKVFDKLEEQFSQALRRKIKRSEDGSIQIAEDTNPDPLVSFIEQSYRQHHIRPPVSSQSLLSLFQNAIEAETGRLFYLHDHSDAVAGIFVVTDANCVYALYSGMSDTHRKAHYTDYLHAALFRIPEFEGKIFDFLGANTPDFDQFKRSFGGSLVSYYKITYQRNRLYRLLSNLRKIQHTTGRRITRS